MSVTRITVCRGMVVVLGLGVCMAGATAGGCSPRGSGPRGEFVSAPGADVTWIAQRLCREPWLADSGLRITPDEVRCGLLVKGASPEQLGHIRAFIDDLDFTIRPTFNTLTLRCRSPVDVVDPIELQLAAARIDGVRATADVRTRRLIVVGAKDETATLIRGWVEELDVAEETNDIGPPNN